MVAISSGTLENTIKNHRKVYLLNHQRIFLLKNKV